MVREQLPDNTVQVAAEPLREQPQPKRQSTEKAAVLSLSKQQLAQNPDLLNRALIPALAQNNESIAAFLLPIYEQSPQPNPILRQWAQALEAKYRGDYEKSVDLYRKLFVQLPNSIPVRYQLAQALFLNQEYDAAKVQFEKLRTENLPPENQQVLDRYLNAINERDRWSFQGGISYLQESNINNAPKNGTKIRGFNAWRQEKGEGFSYSLAADRKWQFDNKYFIQFSFSGFGKYYWDNKKYNELTARAGLGGGYQTTRYRLLLQPFIERVWYAGGQKDSDP